MTKSKLCVALRSVICLSVLGASPAFAQSTTYVVDAAGGVGVNFTDIAPAIAAAQPGDVLVVRDGNYSNFVLDKGLSIIGTGALIAIASASVDHLPSGQVAKLVALQVDSLSITICLATVVVDTCSLKTAAVDQSVDVRFHRSTINAGTLYTFSSGLPAVFVNASRVELSSCHVRGGQGRPWPNVSRGGYGIECATNSRVHVALSRVVGGRGGQGSNVMAVNGGSGGDAIRAHLSAEVIVAGTASTPTIGGNWGPPQQYSGNQRRGFGFLGGALRHSGAPIVDFLGNSSVFAGPDVLVSPPDPTLELVGDPRAGQALTLLVHGVPGVGARLQLGTQPRLEADGLAAIEKLDNRVRLHPLGLIPASGEVGFGTGVANTTPAGWARLYQAFEIDPPSGGLIERTNSVWVIVR